MKLFVRRVWEQVKYRILMTGLFATMAGMILILVFVALPFLLIFTIMVVLLIKVLMWIL